MTLASLPISRALQGADTLLAFVELIYAEGSPLTRIAWSGIVLADPDSYYGGYKEARVLSFGQLDISLSDWVGQLQGSSGWTVRLSDVPDPVTGECLLRSWMELTASPPVPVLTNHLMTVRLITAADRAASKEPITVAKGLVQSIQTVADQPFTFEFVCASPFGVRFNAQVPTRTITTNFFPSLIEAIDITQIAQYPNGLYYVLTAEPHGFEAGELVLIDGSSSDFTGQWRVYPNGVFDFSIAVSGTPAQPVYGGTVRRAHPKLEGTVEPIIYGDTSRRGIGQCPVIYLDEVTLSGAPINPWSRFMVAGHACKAVLRAYARIGGDGTTPPSSSLYWGGFTYPSGAVIPIDQDVDDVGGPSVLLPGHTDYLTYTGQSDEFTDITGTDGVTRRYTFVYARNIYAEFFKVGSQGTFAYNEGGSPEVIASKPGWDLMLDVQGVEDVGDGSGTLLEEAPSVKLDLLCNVLLDTYLTGNRLGIPTYPDGVDMINSASFTAAATLLASIYGVTLPLAGVITKQYTASDLVALVNRSGDLDAVAGDQQGQYAVSVEADRTPDETIRDVDDILAHSFAIRQEPSEFANVIPYKVSQAFDGSDAFAFEELRKDADSIVRYRQEKVADQSLDLPWLHDMRLARGVVDRLLARRKEIPLYVSFARSIHGIVRQLGDVLGVSSRDGFGAFGWTDQHVDLRSMSINMDAARIEHRARVIAPIAITLEDPLGTGTPAGPSCPVGTSSAYVQDWSDGAGDQIFSTKLYARNFNLFMNSTDGDFHGGDPTDAVYPEVLLAQLMGLATGVGPSGENAVYPVPYSPPDPSPWTDAALFIEPTSSVDVSIGRLGADFRPTTSFWDEADGNGFFFSPLLLIHGLIPQTGDLELFLENDDMTDSGTYLYVSYRNSGGTLTTVGSPTTVSEFNRTTLENKWVRFEIEWQAGTVTGNTGNNQSPTSIASDGSLAVYYTNLTDAGARTQLLSVTSIPLAINLGNNSGTQKWGYTAGTQRNAQGANMANGWSFGHAGFAGQITNIFLCGVI